VGGSSIPCVSSCLVSQAALMLDRSMWWGGIQRTECPFCRGPVYHYFPFWFDRWVSLKESQFIYLRIHQICNSFNSNDPSSGRKFESLKVIVLSLGSWVLISRIDGEVRNGWFHYIQKVRVVSRIFFWWRTLKCRINQLINRIPVMVPILAIKISALDYNGERYLSSIMNCVIFRLWGYLL
jgi:hypothetical protein